MKNFLYPAICLFILSACHTSPSKQEKKQALEDSVMQVHDEAMAKMSNIYRLRMNFRKLRDTLEAKQNDTLLLKNIAQEIEGLNQADEAMMNWMHQYASPDSMKHEQAMVYLEQQLTSINKVQHTMDSTIQAAQQTYQKYEQK